VRFALTGVYELTAGHGWMTAAGVVGLALCVIAVFAALAMALEDVLEPGVRPQL
jgi:succinate-acetate transporter protein